MRSEIGQLSRYFHEIFAKIRKFQSKYYNFKQELISRLSQQLTLCFVQLKCRLRKFGYSVQPKNIKIAAIFDLDLEWFLDAKKYLMYLSLEFIIDNGIFCHFICYINFLNQLWLWKFVFLLESFCILGKVCF